MEGILFLCFSLAMTAAAAGNPNVIEQTKSLLANLEDKHPGFMAKTTDDFLWKAFVKVVDEDGNGIIRKKGKHCL